MILVLVELVHLSTAMTSTNNASSSPLSPIDEAQWRLQTQALLERTHRWSGTYSGDFAGANQPYDPYTTYYAILTYQALQQSVPDAQGTVHAITSSQNADGHFSCEAPQLDTMSCIYYNVMALEALGAQPEHIPTIIQHVNALQASSGIYASNVDQLGKLNAQIPDSTADLLSTRQAVTILHVLGGRSSQQTELVKWLTNQWNTAPVFAPTTSVATDEQALSLGATIGASLDALNIHLSDFPNAASRLRWARGLRDSILTLQAGQRHTDLFVIENWLGLIRFLTGRNVQEDLPGETFLSQLASLQQVSGGYNVFFTVQPDMQGTYIAASLFRDTNHPMPRILDVLTLLERQALANGGFAMVYQAQSENADMFATMTSLELRDLLGSQPLSFSDQAALKADVQSSLVTLSKMQQNTLLSSANAELLYSTINLAKRTGVGTESLTPLLKEQAQALRSLVQTQRLVRKDQFAAVSSLSIFVQLDQQDANLLAHEVVNRYTPEYGFGIEGVYNLQTTWLALETLDRLGRLDVLSQPMRAQLTGWIYQHQAPEGGYQERGISYVTGSYYAIESLRVLQGGTTKPDPHLIAWLRSLKLSSGGIRQARDPQQNTPDLAATYQSLLIAQQMSQTL